MTDRQKLILAYVRENPTVSKEGIVKALGLTIGKVKRDLAAMSDVVHYEGASRDGAWKIINERGDA